MIGGFFASLAGKVVLGLIGAGLVLGVGKCVVDGIGDAREARLRKEAVEDRLRTVREGNTREALLRALPALAKARCAAEGPASECCKPEAVKIVRCTAPIE